MNLNCNYIRNRYMSPNLRVYVQVNNQVPECPMFFTVKYFYDGEWITKTSKIFLYGRRDRVYYEKSSSQRDFNIFKRIADKDVFIFNTMLTSDSSVCYEVTGSNTHTFINPVPC